MATIVSLKFICYSDDVTVDGAGPGPLHAVADFRRGTAHHKAYLLRDALPDRAKNLRDRHNAGGAASAERAA